MSLAPIPGNPDVIIREASRMSSTADQLDRAVQVLNGVSNGAYQSLATDAIKGSASELSTTLTKASARYRGAGEALLEFGHALRPLQDRANAAIVAAGHANVQEAQRVVDALHAEAVTINVQLDEAERERIRHAVREAESVLKTIQGEYNRCKDEYNDARRQWNDWARKTAGRIFGTNETSQLNRTGKDSTLNWWHDVLDNIGTVLTIASILLCWVPGLGQILMIAVALVALAALAVSIAQAWKGEKLWGEVLVEGAFAVLSVIGAVKAARLLGKARVFRVYGARLRNVFKPSQFPKWKAKWFGNATRRVAQNEKQLAFKNFFLKEHMMLGSGKKLIKSGMFSKEGFKMVNDMSELLVNTGIQKGIGFTFDYLKKAQTASPSPAGCVQYSSSMAPAR